MEHSFLTITAEKLGFDLPCLFHREASVAFIVLYCIVLYCIVGQVPKIDDLDLFPLVKVTIKISGKPCYNNSTGHWPYTHQLYIIINMMDLIAFVMDDLDIFFLYPCLRDISMMYCMYWARPITGFRRYCSVAFKRFILLHKPGGSIFPAGGNTPAK